MKRMAKISCVFFLAVSLLFPAPCASAKAKDVVSDIMKIAGAQLLIQALAPILGPILGIGPKKTKEQKEKEKQEKKEKKEDKEMEKAAKEAAKQEKAKDAIENPETHISLVNKWAEAGDVQAQCIMCYAYLTGQRVPQDLNMAIVWQNRAAAQNISLVKNFLPLEYGRQVIPLERLFAIAGRRSHIGQYVEQNVKDAVRWSQLGADEKDTVAIAYIASAYYTGRGLPQDLKKAVEIASTADHDPLSLFVLIDAYQFGKGVAQDTKKSERYARYLKTVVEKKHQKEKEKTLKKYEKEIKAGELYGIIR